MCGNFLSGIFGDGDTPPPVVVPTVSVDSDKASAEASAAGIKQRSDRKRAMRAQSLLATGAGGDESNVVTGLPTATATKTKLGA